MTDLAAGKGVCVKRLTDSRSHVGHENVPAHLILRGSPPPHEAGAVIILPKPSMALAHPLGGVMT